MYAYAFYDKTVLGLFCNSKNYCLRERKNSLFDHVSNQGRGHDQHAADNGIVWAELVRKVDLVLCHVLSHPLVGLLGRVLDRLK